MKFHTKYVHFSKLDQINIYTGMTYKVGLCREYMCMKILNEYYKHNKCTCGYKYHFPIIYKYEKNKYIKMTNEGIDLKTLKQYNFKIKVKNVSEQIDCILKTLEVCNITHLDLNNNGKNICVNLNGKISLIDFDIMHMKNYDKFLNKTMLNRVIRFQNTDFKLKILKIIFNCPNIILE